MAHRCRESVIAVINHKRVHCDEYGLRVVKLIGLIIGAVDVSVHWCIVEYCCAKDVGSRATDTVNCEVN